MLCTAAEHILDFISEKVATALNWRIGRFYSAQIFHTMARLDVPTWDDPVVAAQIEDIIPKESNTAAWGAIKILVEIGSTFVKLFSQTAVLVDVLHEQRDGLLLSLISFAGGAVTYFRFKFSGDLHGSKRRIFCTVSSCLDYS